MQGVHKRHKLKRSTPLNTRKTRKRAVAATSGEDRKGGLGGKEVEDWAKEVAEEGWASLKLEVVQLGSG